MIAKFFKLSIYVLSTLSIFYERSIFSDIVSWQQKFHEEDRICLDDRFMFR